LRTMLPLLFAPALDGSTEGMLWSWIWQTEHGHIQPFMMVSCPRLPNYSPGDPVMRVLQSTGPNNRTETNPAITLRLESKTKLRGIVYPTRWAAGLH
jgi:hypothetical protein